MGILPSWLKAAAEPKFITYRGHVFPVGGDHVDVRSPADLQRAAKETGGARVINFSQGEGSLLDRNVKLTTNHNAAGTFERGKLRIDIRDELGGRHVFERPLAQLPSVVSTLLSKGYAALSQHRIKQDTVMKAAVRRILPNPMNTATPREIERCKQGLATIPERVLKSAKSIDVALGDLISIQPTIDNEKVEGMVQAGLANLKKAPSGLGLRYGKKIYLVDGNHRAIAFQRLGETEMPLRVVNANTQKADAGHWITTSGGKHIYIEGGSGGAKPKEQSKPQAQGRFAEPPNTVAELTHDQMVAIAQKLAGKMGIDPAHIEVQAQDEHEEGLGTKVGEHNPATGKITLYPASFAKGKQELIGTLAHEGMHAKFTAVVDEFNKEFEQYQAGESLLSGKLDVYKEIQPVFASRQAEYARADGQTPYSTLFWKEYQQKPGQQQYTQAVHETLAEVERLNQSGQGSDVHPLWRNLAGKVNNFARSLNV